MKLTSMPTTMELKADNFSEEKYHSHTPFFANFIKYYLSFAVLVLSTLLITFQKTSAQDIEFKDVPKTHWAYEAIEELARKGYIDGYPDGTFRGRSFVTRYDLALLAAKIVAKLEDIETAGGVISPEDAELIKKLVLEFRKELEDLGLKYSKLEKTLDDYKKRVEKLEKKSLSMEYTMEGLFVRDYKSTTDIQDDTNGINYIKHKITLHQLFNPSASSEVYFRLIAEMNDLDDKNVIPDAAHIKFKHPKFTFRGFHNEGHSSSSDPERVWNPKRLWLRAPWAEDYFDPWGGIEINAKFLRKFKAKLQTLHWIGKDLYGENWDGFFGEIRSSVFNIANLSLKLGTTYGEVAYSYDHDNNFSSIFAIDLLGNTKLKDTSLRFYVEHMQSKNPAWVLNLSNFDSYELFSDTGTKWQISLSQGAFRFTVDGYNFGKWFYNSLGDFNYLNVNPWSIRRKSYSNYYRKDILGENALKFHISYKYTFPSNRDQSLKLDAVMLQKSWDKNDENKTYNKNTDGHKAYDYNFSITANLSKDMTTNISYSLTKYPLPDSEGEQSISLDSRVKLTDKLSTSLNLSYYEDKDTRNNFGDTFKIRSIEGSLSYTASPKTNIYASAFRKYSAVGWNEFNSDSMVEKENIELTLSLNRKIGSIGNLKIENQLWKETEVTDPDNPVRHNILNLKYSQTFSKYGNWDIEYWNVKKFEDNTRLNTYILLTSSLRIKPTQDTSLTLRWGSPKPVTYLIKKYGAYPETQEMLSLEVSCNF